MTGFIRVKNGIWRMCFSWKDQRGQWQKKEESTGLKEKGNKRKAQAMMESRKKELEDQSAEATALENNLFLDEMQKWLNDIMVHEVRPATLHQYQYVFDGRISKYKPFINLKIKDLTPRVLQGFVTYEAKAGLSPDTIKKHFVNIHKFLRYLWKMDVIQSNPADRVQLPRRDRRQKGDVYTEEELWKLIDLFAGDQMHLFIQIAATYGMRRSEICGLKWDAIDLKNGYLYVQATGVVDCGRVIYSSDTKSWSSRRKLPLTKTLSNALKMERLVQMKNKMMFGESYKDNGFVCCWPDGSPLRPDYVTNHYKRILQKSDLRFVSMRNLRDTAATVLHNQGFDVKSIQGLLGHADVSTTANIYVHFDDRDLHGMVNAMDGIIGKKA